MRILLAAVFLWLAGVAAAGASELPFSPDTPYYFEHFDPQQKPWQPGHGLNIEEVFKNYQYHEIRFVKNSREIQVTHYVQGRKEGREIYRIKPDGTLEKLMQ
ncbi:MAG: hypothetical protein Q8O38_11745 [Sulfurimicrobium sp.]|nr:hypothetical protein [Sulfurimicrobium sp.]